MKQVEVTLQMLENAKCVSSTNCIVANVLNQHKAQDVVSMTVVPELFDNGWSTVIFKDGPPVRIILTENNNKIGMIFDNLDLTNEEKLEKLNEAGLKIDIQTLENSTVFKGDYKEK